MLTWICALSRPSMVANVIAAHRRQTVRPYLLVVENGAAVGAFPRGLPDVSVIRSAPSHSAARNAGLDWVQSLGEGRYPWAMMDDDDYYGPGYAESCLESLTRADVSGKPWEFVMLPDGLWRFASGRELTSEVGAGMTGGTLCGRTARVPRFLHGVGEDLRFCKDAAAAGLSLWCGDRWDYCYDRSSSGPRAWEASPAVVRLSFNQGREAEWYGPVGPETVCDRSAVPVRVVPPQTDDELMAGL